MFRFALINHAKRSMVFNYQHYRDYIINGLYEQTESKQKLVFDRFCVKHLKELSQRNIVSIVESINKFQCFFSR